MAIVDVLRFTTTVTFAVERGLVVQPHRWRDESARTHAASIGAVLADGRDAGGPSLSPASLASLVPGTRVVMPSPNGATCSLRAAALCPTVVAGCLRNASAVARTLASVEGPIAVIACGELWRDGSMRSALEDALGAGAIIRELAMSRSPEAEAAAAIFDAFAGTLRAALWECASGRELRERGQSADVELAAQHDTSAATPVLRGGAFALG